MVRSKTGRRSSNPRRPSGSSSHLVSRRSGAMIPIAVARRFPGRPRDPGISTGRPGGCSGSSRRTATRWLLAGQHGPRLRRRTASCHGRSSHQDPGEQRPCPFSTGLLLRVGAEGNPQRLQVLAQLAELIANEVVSLWHCPPPPIYDCFSLDPADTSPRQAPVSAPRLSIISLNRWRSPRTRRLSSPAAEPTASAGPSSW